HPDRQFRVVKRPSAEINVKLLSLNKGAIHGYRRKNRRTCKTMEQREAARSKASTEVERNLDHQDSIATRSSKPRARVVQSRDRQQVTRVRFSRAPCARRGTRQSHCSARDCHAEKDPTTGSV